MTTGDLQVRDKLLLFIKSKETQLCTVKYGAKVVAKMHRLFPQIMDGRGQM